MGGVRAGTTLGVPRWQPHRKKGKRNLPFFTLQLAGAQYSDKSREVYSKTKEIAKRRQKDIETKKIPFAQFPNAVLYPSLSLMHTDTCFLVD
jgi:hypothetical protein